MTAKWEDSRSKEEICVQNLYATTRCGGQRSLVTTDWWWLETTLEINSLQTIMITPEIEQSRVFASKCNNIGLDIDPWQQNLGQFNGGFSLAECRNCQQWSETKIVDNVRRETSFVYGQESYTSKGLKQKNFKEIFKGEGFSCRK